MTNGRLERDAGMDVIVDRELDNELDTIMMWLGLEDGVAMLRIEKYDDRIVNISEEDDDGGEILLSCSDDDEPVSAELVVLCESVTEVVVTVSMSVERKDVALANDAVVSKTLDAEAPNIEVVL